MSQKVEVYLDGRKLPSKGLKLKVLHNGGAVVGIPKAALKGEAGKTTKKATKSKASKLADGVRFESGKAIVRFGGEDIQTIDQPKADPKLSEWQNQKAFRKAVNSYLWSIAEGDDREKKLASPQWAIHVPVAETANIPIQ